MTSHVYVGISRRMERGFYEALYRTREARAYGDVHERINRREGEYDGTAFAHRLLALDGARSMKAQLILLEVAAESRRNMTEIRASGILRNNAYLIWEAAYDEGYYYGIMAVIAVTWPLKADEELGA